MKASIQKAIGLLAAFLLFYKKGESAPLPTNPAADGIPNFCTLEPYQGTEPPSQKNFRLSEFYSRDIQAVPKSVWGNVQLSMNNLQKIRNELNIKHGGGVTIRIGSGYRTVAYNEDLKRRGYKAATNSQHLCGRAADFSVFVNGIEYKPEEYKALGNLLESKMRGGSLTPGGIGVYTGFIHLDTRGTIRRWNG